MMTFRQDLRDFKLPLSTVWLMNDIAESKGRQELYTKQAPQILKALREQAMVQSVESSNRIEGVTVAPDRLRPLVLGNTRPRDRSEEEIQGYRNALQRIHTGAGDLPITPDTLRDLHRTIQDGSGDAGQWKAVDNDIIELRPGEAPRVRFRTLAAGQVPAAVDELCLLYRHALDQQTGAYRPILASRTERRAEAATPPRRAKNAGGLARRSPGVSVLAPPMTKKRHRHHASITRLRFWPSWGTSPKSGTDRKITTRYCRPVPSVGTTGSTICCRG